MLEYTLVLLVLEYFFHHCTSRAHKRPGPALLDAPQRLLGCKLPIRTRGSGCFRVPRHQNTEAVCSVATSVWDGGQWKPAEDPPAGWGWTARTTSSLSSLRGHGKHQWSLQINSGGPFQSWANSAFINLATLKQEKAKIWRWSFKKHIKQTV